MSAVAASDPVAQALALADQDPHQFTLQYPPHRAYFRERFRARPPEDAFAKCRELLVYVHVPFCARRCTYCNFAVDVHDDVARMARYVEALERSIARAATLPAAIGGIDVGGGTPTRLPPELLARVLAALGPLRARAVAPRPLSVETTPEIAATSPDVLAVLREGGVDRVSVGLQSSEGSVLRAVRRPGPDLHARAFEALRAAGFARLNADLIFGLPGQTPAAWCADVERTIALGPDSITTYDCLYRGRGRALRTGPRAPSPREYAALYDAGFARLRAAGYEAPYGSVNFSRRPAETGTSAYFERRLLDGWPYLGIGNYATSHEGDAWTFAIEGVDAWIRAVSSGEDPIGDAYRLPREETMAKYLLLSLSFGRIDRGRFLRRFGEPLEARWARRLAAASAIGLVEDDRGFAIREGAFGALPRVRALLHTNDALAWLVERARSTR